MDIREECKRILNQNWRNGYTVPSPKLYPFQWNWDSGFIALGYLHFDPEKALTEMEYLFKGQWSNGFLPHIIFHNSEKYGSDYFPSADYWNSGVSEKSPQNLKTTGITQPPIHGYILERMFEVVGTDERFKKLYDQVLIYHKNLYEARETLQNGLLAVWHNWESGMDNSPWWDEALNRISPTEFQHIVLNRKDTSVVANSGETRPSDEEYKRYLWLLETLQKHKFESCPEDFPFQLLDLTFNSLLIASTKCLIKLGPAMDKDVSWLEDKMKQGIASFNALMWNEESGLYYPYDLVTGEQVKLKGAACFLPLFAGICSESQADSLVKNLVNYDDAYGIPSIDPSYDSYEPKKYWRGPIWVNMNYMIWKGLLRYGKAEEAENLKNRTLEMVERYGFREYYPFDKKEDSAYGAMDFSWSASLVLDILNT